MKAEASLYMLTWVKKMMRDRSIFCITSEGIKELSTCRIKISGILSLIP